MMSDNKGFDTALFYEKTNGGLDFFEAEFASEKLKKTSKGFSFNNGSSNVTIKNGIYLFTNFKVESKGVNAINYVMNRDNCDFIAACNTMFSQFNLDTTSFSKPLYLPVKEWTDTNKEVGFYKVDWLDAPDKTEFAPFATAENYINYCFYQIKSYSTVRTVGDAKKVTMLTVTATDDYPIYGYKNETFVKIYEPKAVKNKDGYSSKHHFLGTKPARHIYGWERLKKHNLYAASKYISEDFSIIDESDEADDDDKLIDTIFIATGGSDGLNIASLGYDVVWFNSETEIISEYELRFLQNIAKNVVYIPDLDKTGVDQSVKMGLMSKRHLSIKMMYLPKDVLGTKKDIADWFKLHNKATYNVVEYKFKELLSQALEFQFWDYNPKRHTFVVNNGKLLQFLHYNGFYVYKIPQLDKKIKRSIEEKIFIRIEKNVIKKISGSDVQAFVIQFLKKLFVAVSVQEIFYKSVFFNDNNSIKSLPEAEINTQKTSNKSQMYFYENTILNVTPDAVEQILYNKNEVQVWEKSRINRSFKKLPATTTITNSDDGTFDIAILDNPSNYLKLLINTSRFYWLKDSDQLQQDQQPFNISSKKLTDAEKTHQKQELINKMYCLGYLLHEQKIKQKAFIVIGTDHAIGKHARDNKGGTGKSAIISGLASLTVSYMERNGRELNKDTERFKYTDVDEELRLLHFDEMDYYFDVNKFFADVTADVTCNWKGGKMVYVPFKYFTKLAITMNSVPKDISESAQRRSLNFECSNYYHIKNDDFQFSRQISDDFNNTTLWGDDYSAENWNKDDNFLIECLQFYLSNDKKPNVDGASLVRRSQLQMMHPTCLEFLTQFWKDYNTINPETERYEAREIDGLQFTGTRSGETWINVSKIHELYSIDNGKKAVNLADFGTNLNLFFDNKIEIKKQKINGKLHTVNHFKFLIVNEVEAVINEKIEQEKPPIIDVIDSDLPF